MDIFIYFGVLLLTTAATGTPASTVNQGAYDFNNTAVFTQVVPIDDLSIRDAIYITPALMFVGKSDGNIVRCLFNDPSVCETFYSHSNSYKVTSTVISGEYLYASLTNGEMLRCHVYQKNSCTTFHAFNSGINSLAVSGGYIYAGLDDGRMVRYGLHQTDDYKMVNQFQTEIMSLAATDKYIYAGLSSNQIWRCAVASENSCRLIDAAKPGSQIQGMTATEEIVIGVSGRGTLWNCTLDRNCTETSLDISQHNDYKTIAIFDRSFYMLRGSKILICKWGSFVCSTYSQSEGAISLSFAYSTFKMQDRFVNEDMTCLSDARCPPFMTYYEIYQRPMLEVFVKRGKLYNSRGVLVDTRTADVGHAGRAAIFAMGADGQILLSNVHYTVLRTSSLFAGHPVAGAGEMVVENGVIKSIMACSKHYQPTVELNQQVISVLYMKGYKDSIDNLPCCKGNECGQVDVEENTIANEQ